jgi:hypothetical protein
MPTSPYVIQGLRRASFTGGWLDGYDGRTQVASMQAAP